MDKTTVLVAEPLAERHFAVVTALVVRLARGAKAQAVRLKLHPSKAPKGRQLRETRKHVVNLRLVDFAAGEAAIAGRACLAQRHTFRFERARDQLLPQGFQVPEKRVLCIGSRNFLHHVVHGVLSA
jgi:hypothetical protein